MKVLVDTSVWSLAFRRKRNTLHKYEINILNTLVELIQEIRVVMIGVIRQELLSGITDTAQFAELREKLRAFEDFSLDTEDYEVAAQFYNLCRKQGIQGSAIDFLICAAASNHDFALLTTDKDFERYAPHTGIKLFMVSK